MVPIVRERLPKECLTRTYARDGCSVRLTDAPAEHVTVDLDCPALPLPAGKKRCDFVFVGEDARDGRSDAWVAPIELKSGAFSASTVVAQLQTGADLADQWLPANAMFNFVPVVAHGRIRRKELEILRNNPITLREQKRRPFLLRCDSPLRQALDATRAE